MDGRHHGISKFNVDRRLNLLWLQTRAAGPENTCYRISEAFTHSFGTIIRYERYS